MTTASADDIAAIRAEEGNLRGFIAAITNRAAVAAPTPPAIGSIHGPLHRPGAWPTGTRPAGPQTCNPDCDCALTNPPATGPHPNTHTGDTT